MIDISFSWDDGAVEDLKLMDISLKHGIPGIFFIPATNKERDVISKKEIQLLTANNFEVGSHTYSHCYLTQISFKKAIEEMISGKDFLEQITGREVPHFCFPGGYYNKKLVDVSRVYFKSARSADTGALVEYESFLVKPSFHFFDRGKRSLVFNSLKNNSIIFRIVLKYILSADYFDILVKILVELSDMPELYRVIVWGHSWEINQFDLWKKLEDLFISINHSFPGRVSRYSDLIHCTKN
jgi:hypothetical protein